MNSNGSNKEPIFDPAQKFTDLYPKWSPDSSKIAILERIRNLDDAKTMSSIFIDEPNSMNKIQVENENGYIWDFAWTPDNNQIIYDSDANLVFLDINNNEKKIVSAPGFAGEFMLSPDGEKILFHSSEDYIPALKLMDINGNNIIHITSFVDLNPYLFQLELIEWFPGE